MDELHEALAAATRSLNAAEEVALALAKSAAATGVQLADAALTGELSALRQAAGAVHQAVATLLAGTTGQGA